MPFICKFQLNNEAIKERDEIIFIEFIDKNFDSFHEDNVKIASVTINGIPAFISSTCPCFVSSKANLNKGDQINKDTIIGSFSANGEDIPYSKPYARIVFESSTLKLNNLVKIKISTFTKIGIALIIIGGLIFLIAVSLFTYRSNEPISPLTRKIGEYSLFAWIPFAFIGMLMLAIRIMNKNLKT